ncbi:MAG: DUF3117 domain-containing protein [Actinobacteria bacterium]|nr:DUF3117 domain-containing protein [Actinomycetota bacterium]
MARLLPRDAGTDLEVGPLPPGRYRGPGTIVVRLPMDSAGRLVFSVTAQEAQQIAEMLRATV